MSKYETIGGHVTRGETFAKIIDLIDQLRDQCAVMAHLHRAEDGARDDLLATGWLGIAELFAVVRRRVVELAQGRLQ